MVNIKTHGRPFTPTLLRAYSAESPFLRIPRALGLIRQTVEKPISISRALAAKRQLIIARRLPIGVKIRS
jgi:hypothetical protein